ncbi:MAG: hypothetical protein ACI9OJ_003149 [Myxococcota bacterium]|jgi:hypothetical protein
MMWIVVAISLLLVEAPPDKGAVEQARTALTNALQAEANGKPVDVRVQAAAFGMHLVYAQIKDAYPGAGAAYGLVFGKGHYGRHGLDLTALANAQKWFKKAPPADALARLVGQVWFGGLVALSTPVPTLKVTRDRLTLVFVARPPLGHGRSRVTVDIPRQGRAVIARAPIVDGPKLSSDPVQRLKDAMAAKDTAAINAGIEAVGKTSDSRRFELLATLATWANEVISAAAIDALGTSADSATALKAALSKLDAGARRTLLQFIAEYVGEDFAARCR